MGSWILITIMIVVFGTIVVKLGYNAWLDYSYDKHMKESEEDWEKKGGHS